MVSNSLMDVLFQRTIDDLIKGLRVNPLNESSFLSKCMDEIRREIKLTDPTTKAIALQKLSYLHSLYAIDAAWAEFHTIEVMSSSSFSHKKIGYLAASLLFSEDSELLLLMTNQLRKDLSGKNDLESTLALEFLTVSASTDLARDLTNEIFALLGSGKLNVKKKAIAVLVRVFEKYPDSVRVCFKRLVECLDSNDHHVLSAAIGVFCELVAMDPNAYLPLAPEFYRVLVDSKNNWVLIKVVKIFGVLAPLEIRLANKVAGPIRELMIKTNAKSVMFECAKVLVSSFSHDDNAVESALVKIKELLVDEDLNLVYLGLQLLEVLMPNRTQAVEENREFIVKNLSNEDPVIKKIALALVMGMVNEDNVVEISQVLMSYAFKSDPEFCSEITGSILSMCSRNFYELVVDFDWYVWLIGDVARGLHFNHGDEVEKQLVDIALRVEEARPVLVRLCRDLLIDPALLGNPPLIRVLSGAAWIAGEYVELSKDPYELVEALVQPRTNLLPSSVRAIYVHAVLKIFVFCLHSFLSSTEYDCLVNARNGSEIRTDQFAKLKLEGASIVHENKLVSFSSDKVGNLTLNGSEDRYQREAENVVIYEEQDSSSVDAGLNMFSHSSILRLLKLIKTTIGLLLENDDVEVQERAKNIFGLIGLLQTQPVFLVEDEVIVGSQLTEDDNQPRVFETIDYMRGIFCKKFGPVHPHAQKRVSVPDGLVLKENLADLDAILGEDTAVSTSFSGGTRETGEWGAPLFVLNKKDESNSSYQSTSLAEHRKRHEIYYLPTGKDEPKSEDSFPLIAETSNADPESNSDLVKIATHSLAPKKNNKTKRRPTVIKLEEPDEAVTLTSVQSSEASKGNVVSGAVQDLFQMDQGKVHPSSSMSHVDYESRKHSEDRYTQNNGRFQESGKQSGVPLREGSDSTENRRHISSNSKTTKHRKHAKEKHKDSIVDENVEKQGNEQSSKRSHHRSHHKSQPREKNPLSIDPQTTTIPDFLL